METVQHIIDNLKHMKAQVTEAPISSEGMKKLAEGSDNFHRSLECNFEMVYARIDGRPVEVKTSAVVRDTEYIEDYSMESSRRVQRPGVEEVESNNTPLRLGMTLFDGPDGVTGITYYYQDAYVFSV